MTTIYDHFQDLEAANKNLEEASKNFHSAHGNAEDTFNVFDAARKRVKDIKQQIMSCMWDAAMRHVVHVMKSNLMDGIDDFSKGHDTAICAHIEAFKDAKCVFENH